MKSRPAAVTLLLSGLAAILAACSRPPALPPQPLRVVFFSDIHTRTEWDTPEALRMAADAINARQADLILCGGDMITDGYIATPASIVPRWQAYRAFHDAIRPEPVSAIGNHDLVGVEPADGSPPADDPRADVRKWMNLSRTYRSFDRGGYHFILLDGIDITRDDLKYRGFIGPEQMAWLRDDLARVSPETPIVVVTHLPLLTRFYRDADGQVIAPPSNRAILNHREVLDAFAGHRLLAVLQGHLHVHERFEHNGTTFLTGGAVCGMWWRGSWQGTPEGFLSLTLYPDRVESEYVSYGWQSRRPAGR